MPPPIYAFSAEGFRPTTFRHEWHRRTLRLDIQHGYAAHDVFQYLEGQLEKTIEVVRQGRDGLQSDDKGKNQ